MFLANIKQTTKENTNFRTVLHTGLHSQLVVMHIPIGEDIGEEVHDHTDQTLFIVEGEGQAIINGETRSIEEHDVVFVPAGAVHNFKNTGDEALKLFTMYAPAQHAEGTVHSTKADAQKAESQKEGGE